MAAITTSQYSIPANLNDLCRAMVVCNIKKSLEPLGCPSLSVDSTIESFAKTILLDLLPKYSVKTPDLGRKLASQVAQYFKSESAEKISSVVDDILIACGSDADDKKGADTKERLVESTDLPDVYKLSAEERFQSLMEAYPKPRNIQEKMERCSVVMSIVLREFEIFKGNLLIRSLADSMDEWEGRLTSKRVSKTSREVGPDKNLKKFRIDLAPSEENSFPEICSLLHLRKIQAQLDRIRATSQEAIHIDNSLALADAIASLNRLSENLQKYLSVIAAVNPKFEEIGQLIGALVEMQKLQIVLSRIQIRMCEQDKDKFPRSVSPDAFIPLATPMHQLVMDGMPLPKAWRQYFSLAPSQAALYLRARQEWDVLLPTFKGKTLSYPTSCFASAKAKNHGRLPEELPSGERYLHFQQNLPAIIDEFLPSKAVQADVKETKKKSKPSAAAIADDYKGSKRKKKNKPKQDPFPLPSVHAVEVSPPPLAPSAAAAAPSSADLVTIAELPHVFDYDPRVERWFAADPDQPLDPELFPDYVGISNDDRLKSVCYHAFPIEVDGYLDEAVQRTWTNTKTGHADLQYLIPAEFQLPYSPPIRGAISYVVGEDGLCYHRFFHPMGAAQLVEKFGMGRFEQSDFPELSKETQSKKGSKGLAQPASGTLLDANQGLGTVSFRDERTGAIVRIFRN